MPLPGRVGSNTRNSALSCIMSPCKWRISIPRDGRGVYEVASPGASTGIAPICRSARNNTTVMSRRAVNANWYKRSSMSPVRPRNTKQASKETTALLMPNPEIIVRPEHVNWQFAGTEQIDGFQPSAPSVHSIQKGVIPKMVIGTLLKNRRLLSAMPIC